MIDCTWVAHLVLCDSFQESNPDDILAIYSSPMLNFLMAGWVGMFVGAVLFSFLTIRSRTANNKLAVTSPIHEIFQTV